MIKKLKHTFILFGFIMLTITCCLLLSACDNKQDQDYIINFIVDKQLYYNTIVSNNKSIAFPEEPYKNGYSFEGWYYIQNYQEIKFDTDYLKNNKLTKDLNIYAKFKAKNLTVLLNLNGGTCEMQTISVSYGKPFSLPTPTRNGYDFDGWYLTDEDEIIKNTIWDYDTTTLVAKWKQIFEISGNKIVGVTQYGKTLNYIEIPETIDNENIVYLNSNSFAGCTNLKNIVIPNSIKEIGIGTFYDCSNLKEITIPFVGDTESSDNTFGYIFGTQKYIGSTETIQNKISYYLPTTLTKVTITGGTIVKSSAFCNCTNLETIIIPKNIRYIGDMAFYNCINLEDITIPEQVSSISDYSFSNCVNLKIINIPENVSSIGDNAFCNCSNLEEITIPEQVKSIGYKTFSYCSNVTKLYYNAINCKTYYGTDTDSPSFSKLGSNTLGTTLFIGNKVNVIPSFYNSNIKNIVFKENSQCLEIGERAFSNLSIKDIKIPNSVTKIDSYAFYNCTNLEEITIPEQVSSIGDGAFSYCSNVTKLYYNSINCADFIEKNSYTDTAISIVFYRLGENTSGTELYIGKKVERIPANLFYLSNNNITKIEFEKNSQCLELGKQAFYGCDNLKYILFTYNLNTGSALSTGHYDIYCFGTEEEYSSIRVYRATKYYYSETQPQKSGNYWHYDTDNNTILIWE